MKSNPMTNHGKRRPDDRLAGASRPRDSIRLMTKGAAVRAL